MRVDHADYTNPGGRGCDRVRPEDITPGDYLWIRHPDGFNPWFIPVHVDRVTPCRGGIVRLEYSTAGTDGRLYDCRRAPWGNTAEVHPDSQYRPVYRCREVPAVRYCTDGFCPPHTQPLDADDLELGTLCAECRDEMDTRDRDAFNHRIGR